MAAIQAAQDSMGTITVSLATIVTLLDEYETANSHFKPSLSAINDKLTSCNTAIGDFNLLIYPLSADLKTEYSAELRKFRTSYSVLKSRYNTAVSGSTRNPLSGSYKDNDYDLQTGPHINHQAQREQLMKNNNTATRSNEQLLRTKALLRETHEVGRNTVERLQDQNEQLNRAEGRLQVSMQYLDQAIGTLGQMIRRAGTNRIVTTAIISVLVLLIIAVIFSKFH